MLYHFYVGSYNKADEDSIFYCSLDSESGRMTIGSTFHCLTNPSYLLFSRDKKYLFAVEELTPKGNVAILKENGGHPAFLMKTSTEGADPCQLTLNANDSVLYVANYTSGSLASCPATSPSSTISSLSPIR